MFIYLVGILTVWGVSGTLDTATNALLYKKTQNHQASVISTKLGQWQELIQNAQHLPEKQKLQLVNDFFNQQIAFVDDIDLWGVSDYWSTPKEILSKGAGDCEDYSIAKYFTLKKLGIAEHKIRLTYVKSLNRNRPHMVVTYYISPDAIPFILDNLNQTIKSASKRNDLLPIYSFNDSGFWLEKFKGNSKKLGDSNQLSMWINLKKRMQGIS